MLKIELQELTAFFFPSDVVKCKKDRSSGAQQCPVCASPKNHEGKSLVDVPSASLTCTKPAIHDSLKLKNLTVPDDGDFNSISPKEFIAPIGSMVLNMTDQAGSRGNLVCNIQKPKEMSPISFDKDGNSTVLKTAFSAFLVCGIDYEHIQQLWSILALYSNSPLKLERSALATNMPFISYKYKQIYSEKDELFTNIETELRAEPPWLMQSKVALQLDRTATTLNTLHIQYFTDAQIILPSADKRGVRNNWAIISRDNKTQTEHTVLVGGTVELECQAIGEPAPAVEWILADGSKVRAPYISEDGRIIVVKTGTFTLRTADTFDTGLYHCIGTNYNDADTLTFRITVVDPYVEHSNVNGAQLSTFVGSTLYLPCTSTAVPDASISWVLPEHAILHHSVRNKHIFDNGTLKIQGVTEQDSGYFRCVAANQYGVDLLVFQVLVRKDETALKKKQIVVGEWEEGDGSGNAMLASAKTEKHPLATLAPLTANQESAASAFRNRIAQTAHERNGYRNMTFRHYRDKISKRLRGHRRQFVSSARRVDPQRWAAFLEKTKRKSTLMENQGEVATNPPIEVHTFSELPGIEEETSGDLVSLDKEFMIPVTETVPVSTLRRATENIVTAGPEMTTRNTPAIKTSLLASEAVTPLPYPFSQSLSSDSRRPQTYLKPTVTNSWERSDLSLISASGVKQSTHQQMHIIQNITTHTPQALQQYGRRRKISGRRQIVRPGRIPSMKEHRYDLGRPGSGSTAVVADVQLNMKYMSNLPTLNNLSSSINPFSPEAPLSSPSITNMPLEHLAGTQQNTMFLRKEENEASERDEDTTVMTFIMKDTTDTPEWKLQSSAPFQTGTDTVQPFTIRLPTTATHTAHVATDTTYTVSTKVSSTLESVSPSIKPRTSPEDSQRGKITWELLFGNGAQKEVLKKRPKQTDKFPSTEVSTMPPKTTTSLSVFRMSPLHFMPISTGGNHSNGFLSLNKAIHYGNAKSEHLPTAKLHSSSNPATSATKEMDVTHLKPTVRPIIAPQTDTKITKNKTYRMGKKRGQKRKRPLMTSISQSMTAGHSTAAILPMNTAMPVATTVKSLTMPTSPMPAKPLSESVSAVSMAEVPALWILNTPDAPQLTPAAAMQTLATPVMWRNSQSAMLPQSPTTPIQTTPQLSKPFSTPSTRPATAWVAAGSEPAQQIEATATAGEQSWPKPEKSVTQDDHVVQPTFPARSVSSASAASTDITPASTQHPTPPPALTAVVPSAHNERTNSPLWGAVKLWQKPSAKVTERVNMLAINTLTMLKSSQIATPHVPVWGSDKDSSVKGWSEKRQDQETTTPIPIALDSLSRNHVAKPRIIGGKLAAFTVLANSDAFIPCEATGNPYPTIQWTKISTGKLDKPL